jgi:hypothetical protein
MIDEQPPNGAEHTGGNQVVQGAEGVLISGCDAQQQIVGLTAVAMHSLQHRRSRALALSFARSDGR